jgi:PKD repeat protein
MKTKFQLLLVFLLGFSFIVNATTPENSNWIRNISEGEGEPPTGFQDYKPEFYESEGVLHTFWLTWSSPRTYNYRRSTDGGDTWDEKKTIYTGDDALYHSRYKRMAVSGKYVHLIVNNNKNLLYYRSEDNGATFLPVDTIYTTTHWIEDIQIAAEGSNVFISYVWDCHYCGTKRNLWITKSTDNGANFQEPVHVIEDVPGRLSNFYQLKVSGDNVYMPYYESVNVWYDYDYNFHILSSNDGGTTWQDNIVSEPSADGWHHPLQYMGSNLEYGWIPKIATDGSTAWIIWGGWDENDAVTVFSRRTTDGGQTWGPLQKLNGSLSIGNFVEGSSIIAGRGEYVYAAWLTNNSRVWVVRSNDGGQSWQEPEEFTVPLAHMQEGVWYPWIEMDPLSNDAFIVTSGPNYARIPADGSDFYPTYIGNYTQSTKSPVIQIDSEGRFHFIYAGGNVWTQTGVFTDYDVLYRKIDPAYEAEAMEDRVLQLKFIRNEGDGSGRSVSDNFIAPSKINTSLQGSVAIEFWMKPEESGYQQRILAQGFKHFWFSGQPKATQIWQTTNGQIVVNFETETGGYQLWSSVNVTFEHWNHIALVYNNDGGQDNLKLLINGQEAATSTASGDMAFYKYHWVLGYTDGGFGGHISRGFTGSIDELRFWNTTKTIDDIKAGMFDTLSGDEEGLVAWYNFSEISEYGEVYDASGNSNNGLVMYEESLVESTIKEVGAGFTYEKQAKTFFFRHMANIESNEFSWDFGDGNTSDQANPQHTYEFPGVYTVCLSIQGEEMTGTHCEEIIINGVQRYTPHSGGNTGEITLRIYGGGLNEATLVHMSRDGYEDLVPYELSFYEPDLIMASFHIRGQDPGEWDVIVTNGDVEAILERKFTIVEGGSTSVWARASTPRRTRPYRWEDVYITYGNDGNMDALLTPLMIFLPDPQGALEVDFLGMNEVRMPGLENVSFDSLEFTPLYVEIDTFGLKPEKGRLYMFQVPVIPANSSKTFKVRVKTPETIYIRAFATTPWIDYFDEDLLRENKERDHTALCLLTVMGDILKDELANTLDDIYGCVVNLHGAWFAHVKDPKNKPDMYNAMYNWSLALADCGIKAGKLVAKKHPLYKAWDLFSNAARYLGYIEGAAACLGIDIYKVVGVPLFTYAATDPNEIYGPEGYGEFNYIRVAQTLSYQIAFENKPDAQAPAAEVYIRDTLDTEFYDINAFEIGPFGFGDTVIIPPPGLSSYTTDIDLRPEQDLIVRVTGQISPEGIAFWYFASLMPDSLVVPQDPFIGFLPPNASSPEGEGFVSYNIGLKEGIEHEDYILNQASIVFDYNPQILTNVHRVSFDLVPPESEMTTSQSVFGDTTFQIQIEGSDDGVGLSHYAIYVSHNDSLFEFLRYLPGSVTSFDFSGEAGSNYKMYAIAIDSVGNTEMTPSTADIDIDVITDIGLIEILNGLTVYPTVNDGQFNIRFNTEISREIRGAIFDMSGRELEVIFDRQVPAGEINMECNVELLPGMYLLRLTDGQGSASVKFIIQ